MRRAKWGIGAAAVVGLAWFLSNFFNMDIGGIGTDRGIHIEAPSASLMRSPEEPRDDAEREPPLQTEPETEPVAAIGPEEAVGSEGAVEVLIDDRTYYLRRGAGDDAEWVEASGDAVVSYAEKAKGDSTGVRVRLFRRPTARASAEETLIDALGHAGLTSAEIDVPEKLVE